MTPSREALLARRDQLSQHIDRMRATPAPEPTGKRGDPAKKWHAELADLEEMLQRVDRLLGVTLRSIQAAAPSPAPAAVPAKERGSTVIDLARIPKGRTAEMRVSVKIWRGRRTVDIRLWYIPEGSSEWVPSRKGVSVDASKMPALLDALHAAGQHTPQTCE